MALPIYKEILQMVFQEKQVSCHLLNQKISSYSNADREVILIKFETIRKEDEQISTILD